MLLEIFMSYSLALGNVGGEYNRSSDGLGTFDYIERWALKEEIFELERPPSKLRIFTIHDIDSVWVAFIF